MKEKNMKRVEGFEGFTAEQEQEIEQLAKKDEPLSGSEDIPEWNGQAFADAIRLNGMTIADAMSVYKARKAPITTRIDMDVLAWLKSHGDGYQTLLNSILRKAMMDDLRRSRGKP